jgi:osomolarity two-component system sensor histidine kinase TcsA
LPVLDGIGATVEIRKLGLEIPIVAMTANAIRRDKERCLAVEMDDYLPKPVDRQQLLRILLHWLK